MRVTRLPRRSRSQRVVCVRACACARARKASVKEELYYKQNSVHLTLWHWLLGNGMHKVEDSEKQKQFSCTVYQPPNTGL